MTIPPPFCPPPPLPTRSSSTIARHRDPPRGFPFTGTSIAIVSARRLRSLSPVIVEQLTRGASPTSKEPRPVRLFPRSTIVFPPYPVPHPRPQPSRCVLGISRRSFEGQDCNDNEPRASKSPLFPLRLAISNIFSVADLSMPPDACQVS